MPTPARSFLSIQRMFREAIRERAELRRRGYTTCHHCAGLGSLHFHPLPRPCPDCRGIGLLPPPESKSPVSGA